MGRQGILGLLAAALAWVSIGCGTILRNAAEEVTPAVIAGAVEGLSDPEIQRQMVASIDEGRVRTVSARLSAGMVDGMLDTLEEPARRARLEAIVNGVVENASGTMVDSMFEHALEDKVQARMRAAMRATTVDLINATFETIGSNVGSAEERTQAMGAAAHEISKQVTLGFQDALDDTRRDRESGVMMEEDGALVIAAGKASKTGNRILWILGIGFAAVVLGLAIALVWAVRKNRLRRAELQQRDDALLLLTEAIKSTATQPGAGELHAVLKTSLRDRKGGEYFLRMLGEQGRTLLGMQDKAG
jgi:hypothetical protein